MQKEWNIQALELDLQRQLAACTNDFERGNVVSFHRMEVRQLADKLYAEGRLTPGGRAIAESHSWSPRRATKESDK